MADFLYLQSWQNFLSLSPRSSNSTGKDLKRQCKGDIRCIKQRKIEAAVKDGNGSNSWLGKLELLLNSEVCSDRNAGVLPEHLSAGLSRLEQAEDYALHISSISREYVLLTKAKLPKRVQHALDNALCKGHPSLPDHEIFKILSERKVTAGVEGDLDPRVVKECLVELVHPIGCVYREAVDKHQWPVIWKGKSRYC